MGEVLHEGLPIAGYRPQETSAVNVVNENKKLEEEVLRVLDILAGAPGIDGRWLAIGRTHIEQGFMAVNRAVFKPGRVALPGDAGAPQPTVSEIEAILRRDPAGVSTATDGTASIKPE